MDCQAVPLFGGEGQLSHIKKAQRLRRASVWHAARPLRVSHTELPGEYFLTLLITSLLLLALRNQPPGFIDLPQIGCPAFVPP